MNKYTYLVFFLFISFAPSPIDSAAAQWTSSVFIPVGQHRLLMPPCHAPVSNPLHGRVCRRQQLAVVFRRFAVRYSARCSPETKHPNFRTTKKRKLYWLLPKTTRTSSIRRSYLVSYCIPFSLLKSLRDMRNNASSNVILYLERRFCASIDRDRISRVLYVCIVCNVYTVREYVIAEQEM